MLAELILVSTMSFKVTSYRSVVEQTDDTPFHTSIGLHVREGFCAVSQDLLGKQISYGDVLFVEVPAKPELNRYCFVADTMNKRNKNSIDFWVRSKSEERAVNVRRGFVYKLKSRDLIKTTTNTNSLDKLLQPQCIAKRLFTPTPRLKDSFRSLLNVNDNVNHVHVEGLNTKLLNKLKKLKEIL